MFSAPLDKDALVAHYTEQDRQAAAEIKQRRDADNWNRLKSMVASSAAGPQEEHAYIRALMTTIEMVSLARSTEQ